MYINIIKYSIFFKYQIIREIVGATFFYRTNCIGNRGETALKEVRLQITQELEKLQEISTHASDLATLTFINKNLKILSNKLESRHVSSQLGLDHRSADSFHHVQDGFGHTIH